MDAEDLKELRKSTGMLQKEFAETCDIYVKRYKNYERGTVEIMPWDEEKILNHFGMKLQYKPAMNRLRELRIKRGMSMRDMADEVDIDEAVIGHIERHKNYTSEENWRKLSDYFVVSLDYLMGRSEKEWPTKKDVSADTDNA